MTIRETEVQLRHYAPARYLCGLNEMEWTPDANTIQDFEQLLVEDGIRRLNAGSGDPASEPPGWWEAITFKGGGHCQLAGAIDRAGRLRTFTGPACA
jgi:hypothetical protein